MKKPGITGAASKRLQGPVGAQTASYLFTRIDGHHFDAQILCKTPISESAACGVSLQNCSCTSKISRLTWQKQNSPVAAGHHCGGQRFTTRFHIFVRAGTRCVRNNMAGIVICVSGLPGAMGHEVSQACLRRGMTLAPVGLTGPSMPGQCQVKEGDAVVDVTLVGPETPGAQKQALEELRKQHGDRLVIIDFTHPTAVNPNSELYASAGVNFVFGTTGGDRDALMKVTQDSGVYAVIAPNMGKQIVALQATMERMAKDFPGAFSGYKLEVTESHQKTKADTSGTAKAMVASFQQLGVEPFGHDQIHMLRDDASQRAFGVPEEYSTGHAFHTYTLTSSDGSVQFQFKHNVCGRRTYGEGVADAVQFIARKAAEKSEKKVFNMIDILEAGEMK